MKIADIKWKFYPFLGSIALLVLPWFKFSYLLAMSPLLVWALLALSYDFILGKAGIPSFGQAIPFGLGALFSAYFLAKGIPFLAVLLASGFVGMISYAMVGGLVRRLRGIYYAILTLVIGETIRVTLTNLSRGYPAITVGVISELTSTVIPLAYLAINVVIFSFFVVSAALNIKDAIRKPNGAIRVLPYAFLIAISLYAFWEQLSSTISFLLSVDKMSYVQAIRFLSPVNTYFITSLTLLVSYLALSRLSSSPVGTVIVAVRENQLRAEAIGYNAYIYQLIAFSASGFFAGLAGTIYVLSIPSVTPDILGVGITFTALISVIVGGIGTLIGPVLGGVIVGWLLNYLSSVSPLISNLIPLSYQSILSLPSVILGIVYIAVVLLLPYGIYGTWLLKGYLLKRKLESMLLRRGL